MISKTHLTVVHIDKTELLKIVEEDGDIKMHCQFCNKEYRFDALDVETIHSGFDPDASPTQQ